MINFINIDGHNRFYITSKTLQEGFEEIKWEVGDRRGISYRKYIPLLEGTLTDISLKKAEGLPSTPLFISIKIDTDSELYVLDIPLMDNKQEWLSAWAVSAASVLYNLNKGDKIKISTNTFKTDKGGKLYKSLYIRKDDELLPLLFTYKDTPKWVISDKKNKITKEIKKEVNKEAYDEFVMSFIDKAINKFRDIGSTPNIEEPTLPTNDNDDDLPF